MMKFFPGDMLTVSRMLPEAFTYSDHNASLESRIGKFTFGLFISEAVATCQYIDHQDHMLFVLDSATMKTGFVFRSFVTKVKQNDNHQDR